MQPTNRIVAFQNIKVIDSKDGRRSSERKTTTIYMFDLYKIIKKLTNHLQTPHARV